MKEPGISEEEESLVVFRGGMGAKDQRHQQFIFFGRKHLMLFFLVFNGICFPFSPSLFMRKTVDNNMT